MHRFSREQVSKEPSCYSEPHANGGKQFWFPLQHSNNGRVWVSERQRRTGACNRALTLAFSAPLQKGTICWTVTFLNLFGTHPAFGSAELGMASDAG